MSGDGPMRRALFVEMNTEQQVTWLDGVRARRLRAVEVYKKLVAEKRAAKNEKLTAALQKELAMFEKEALALEKALTKVEVRVNKLSLARAMIEADTQEGEQ